MELRAYAKYIDTAPIEHVFTQGEAYADKIVFIVDAVNNGVDVSRCTFVMRTVASDDSMTETVLEKSIEGDLILLTWHVPDTATAVAGMLQLEIIGSQDAQLIIKYMAKAVYVKKAVFGANIPVPDVTDAKLAEMNEILESANVLLEEARKKLDEAQALAVVIDATLTQEGQAADAKAAGMAFTTLQTAIAQNKTAIERVQEDMKNIQTSSESIQEVVDARTGSLVQRIFASLAERLNADFGVCITQGDLEKALSSVTSAYTNADNEVKKSVEELHNSVKTNATNINAMDVTVKNLQNNAVKTAATAGEAFNKANACLERVHSHENKNVIDTITSANIAAWNSAATKTTQNTDAIEAVRKVAVANQTKVTALDAAVKKLQDEDVSIGKNIAEVRATATEALNKATRAIDTITENSALTLSTIGMAYRRNILKNTASSTTKNGVTFTVNGDGSVTVNGTATADTELIVRNMTLQANTSYILTGCPSGGSASTYHMYTMNTSTWSGTRRDVGSGATLATGEYTGWTVRIKIASGCTTDSLVFYPMLRYAEVTDDTYEPYTPSLQEQINALTSAVEALGGATSTTEV
jgi:hypothetical protein